jgi:hypothetical protein
MKFRKMMGSVSKAVQNAPKVSSGASSGGRGIMGKLAKSIGKVASKAAAPKPTEAPMADAPNTPPASSGRRGILGGLKKALKGRKIGPIRFKEGGEADKTGRAMKKTAADAKGRAMTKAPKKMMGGGMAKYAKGGQVACGPATRGYGAARKSK